MQVNLITDSTCTQFILLISNMNEPRLRDLDMTALLVFDAMLEERSVTRAARRLGMTQSAVSHALNRLRDVWRDPLFMRRGTGMVPSQRALALMPGIGAALGELRLLIGEAERFDLAGSRRRFVLGMSDYAAALFLPRLLDRAGDSLGRVTFLVRHASHAIGMDMLDRGDVECLIGSFPAPPARMREETLLQERFVCAARTGHPLFESGLSLDAYAAAHHIHVSLSGEPSGLPDQFLARAGRSRHVAMTIGHFLVLPQILASSDLIATEPQSVLAPFLTGFGVATRPTPFRSDPFAFSMIWHARSDRDPAHDWLRGAIKDVAAAERAGRSES